MKPLHEISRFTPQGVIISGRARERSHLIGVWSAFFAGAAVAFVLYYVAINIHGCAR